MSARDHREIELTEPVRIREDVDPDDAPALDGQREDGEGSAIRRPGDAARDAVHEDTRRRLRESSEAHRLFGDRSSAAGSGHQLWSRRTAIGLDDDVRVEHREEAFEVAVTRGGEEGLDDAPLAIEINVRDRSALHPATSPACELTCRGRRPADDRPD